MVIGTATTNQTDLLVVDNIGGISSVGGRGASEGEWWRKTDEHRNQHRGGRIWHIKQSNSMNISSAHMKTRAGNVVWQRAHQAASSTVSRIACKHHRMGAAGRRACRVDNNFARHRWRVGGKNVKYQP